MHWKLVTWRNEQIHLFMSFISGAQFLWKVHLHTTSKSADFRIKSSLSQGRLCREKAYMKDSQKIKWIRCLIILIFPCTFLFFRCSCIALWLCKSTTKTTRLHKVSWIKWIWLLWTYWSKNIEFVKLLLLDIW